MSVSNIITKCLTNGVYVDHSLQLLVRIMEEDMDLMMYIMRKRKKECLTHIKIQNSLATYLGMHSEEFKRHIRCTPETFNNIMHLLDGHMTSNLAALDPRLRVLTALAYFGQQESFREVAHLHGIADSTAHAHVHEVTKALLAIAPSVIKFPSCEEDYHCIAAAFEQKTSFPGIIGCIDGSYIPLSYVPHEDYINRKNTPSMILQAVCDNNMIFTSIYTGWPGRVHDSRVFGQSNLAKEILPKLPERYHILGDAAYPLSISLLTPYKGRNLSPDKERYNHIHSKNRIVIERSFALLKGRWRKLKHVNVTVTHIPNLINACCVLHNICLRNGDAIDLEDIEPQEDDAVATSVNRAGSAKRDGIKDLLHL